MMGRVVATLLPTTNCRPVKLVVSAIPGYLLVPKRQHSHRTIVTMDILVIPSFGLRPERTIFAGLKGQGIYIYIHK